MQKFEYSASEFSLPPVTDKLLARIVRRLRSAGAPLKIVFFGSRAKGTEEPESDLDIMVIDEAGTDIQSAKDRYDHALDGVYPELSLFVYTIRDVADWCAVPNHLISDALSYGRVLFQDHQRLAQYYRVPGAGKTGESAILVCEGSERKTACDLARGWFERGDRDLLAATTLMPQGLFFNLCCFLAQQAIEKYLKGFLALYGGKFYKTHNLDSLRFHCRKQADLSGLSTIKLKRITKYYESTRYDAEPCTEAQAREAVAAAKQVKAIILSSVPAAARPQLSEQGDS